CAGRHGRKGVGADVVALLRSDRVGADVLRRDGGTRKRGTRGVFHFTGDRAQSLSTRGSPKNHADEYAQDPSHHAPLLDDSRRRPTETTRRLAIYPGKNTSVMGTDGTGSISGRVLTVPVTTAESWNRFQKRPRGLYHHGDTLSIGAATRRGTRAARAVLIVAARSCSRERPTSSGNGRLLAPRPP